MRRRAPDASSGRAATQSSRAHVVEAHREAEVLDHGGCVQLDGVDERRERVTEPCMDQSATFYLPATIRQVHADRRVHHARQAHELRGVGGASEANMQVRSLTGRAENTRRFPS